jgi:hypothetical protein
VLDKPTTIVSVPRPLRFVGALTAMLSPRARRWLSKRTGNDRVFMNFDAAARKSYEDRAQSSHGVTEHRE